MPVPPPVLVSATVPLTPTLSRQAEVVTLLLAEVKDRSVVALPPPNVLSWAVARYGKDEVDVALICNRCVLPSLGEVNEDVAGSVAVGHGAARVAHVGGGQRADIQRVDRRALRRRVAGVDVGVGVEDRSWL